MDFKGAAMEHLKVILATIVEQHEKILNSRLSRMTKAVTFLPWWQPFNSFCFEIIFLLAMAPQLLPGVANLV